MDLGGGLSWECDPEGAAAGEATAAWLGVGMAVDMAPTVAAIHMDAGTSEQ